MKAYVRLPLLGYVGGAVARDVKRSKILVILQLGPIVLHLSLQVRVGKHFVT